MYRSMTRFGLDMAENTITVISEGRNLRALPFRPTEDQLLTGKLWEDWLESIEREFRFFRIADPTDRKDALIIYGGSEIARLEKSLPDPEDPRRELDSYQKLRVKLNAYFLPKKNKHYARYIFLKTRPEAGEATVTYATRLREKANECEFGDMQDDRILEHLIQTIENQHLIQKCISKSWTLQQFLTEAGQIEDFSQQVQDMKTEPTNFEIAKVVTRRNKHRSEHPVHDGRDGNPEQCSYCGLTRAHPKGKNCPAYGVQCDICKKFNHFSSLCRTNIRQGGTDQRSRLACNRKKPSIKRAEELYSSSETSSDEDFIDRSMRYMRIKTVKETTEEEENASKRDIQHLQGKMSQLESEIRLIRNLIHNLIAAEKQTKEQSYQTTHEQPNINWENSETSNGFLYNKADYSQRESVEWEIPIMMNSEELLQEHNEEKEENLHHVEPRTNPAKKRRKKKAPRTV